MLRGLFYALTIYIKSNDIYTVVITIFYIEPNTGIPSVSNTLFHADMSFSLQTINIKDEPIFDLSDWIFSLTIKNKLFINSLSITDTCVILNGIIQALLYSIDNNDILNTKYNDKTFGAWYVTQFRSGEIRYNYYTQSIEELLNIGIGG